MTKAKTVKKEMTKAKKTVKKAAKKVELTKEEKIEEIIGHPCLKELFEQQQKMLVELYIDNIKSQLVFVSEIEELERDMEDFRSRLNFDVYRPLIVKCYDAHFNDDEIELLYNLYQNPIYVKMMDKTPDVIQILANQCSQLTNKIAEEYAAELEAREE